MVLISRCNDQYIVEVFCGRANERDSTNVNLFNNIVFGPALRDCFFKGIEIDNHELNRTYLEFFRLIQIARVFSTVKNFSKHRWMECLDTTTEDGWIARQVLYACNLVSELLNEFLCSACRNEFNSLLAQQMNNGFQII